MPLYEYRCPDCDHLFEILQRMGEGAEGLACPECGAPEVEKQLSTFASSSSSSVGSGASAAVAPGCGAGGFT